MRLVNDKVFKAVFGSESTKEILTAFINAILDYPDDRKITELILLNPFSDENYTTDKTVVMDIKARDKQGRNYNIEVQIIPPFDYMNRVVFYLAKLLSEQLLPGETYKRLVKTISISIVSDKVVFDGLKDFHNIFRYKHIEKDYELGDVTELHFIELKKYVKTQPAELHTKLDKWIDFLKFGDVYKNSGHYPEELEKEKEIAMAIDKFSKVSADEKFRYYLMDLEKANRDHISEIEYAREEGELKGKLEVAKKLLADGIPALVIMKATGLSEEEINKIN